MGGVALRRSGAQRRAPTGPVCPAGGRSAAATHLVATAPRPRPALLLTVPRTAPTTSTADASVSAEVMQPPLETSTVSATAATPPPGSAFQASRTRVRNQRRTTSAVLGCETLGCQPDVVANDGSAWPRSLRLAQRDLSSVIGMMAGPGRSPDVPEPGHRLLRWSFSRSFHQALLQPTRPHWAESRPNLSCLDPTGAV